METRRILRPSKPGSTQTKLISKKRKLHSGALFSNLSLTCSRLGRSIADIYAMTKMGNKLLEKGLYLIENCSYARRSSPSSSTTTFKIGILTPVGNIPPYARERALQWRFVDRGRISRTHAKFIGAYDGRHRRAARRINFRRFTFRS
jgi:hypothetical protein